MAFGTPVAGTIAYSAQNGTSVSPSYPASIVDTDQLVLILGQKPSTANGGTATTPSGWTLREELTAAGGYGTTLGADTGNTNIRIYTKDVVTAGLTGTVPVSLSQSNVAWACIVRVPTGGGTISYGSSDGSDTTAGSVSVTLAANPGLTAGDFCLWAMCIPTDVTTPAQFSAHAISAAGATFATPTEINEPDSGTGNDIGGFSAWTTVSSGTATAAPTITATAGGTTTNVRGPLALLRMREAALPARTGDLAATESGADTASASGDVVVQGSASASEAATEDVFVASGALSSGIAGDLAATESGADTAAASGDVFVTGTMSPTEAGADTASMSGDVFVAGALVVSETGQDTASASGGVIVVGTAAASEAGEDVVALVGSVPVQGDVSAVESGEDVFAGSSLSSSSGDMAAVEDGQDGFSAEGSAQTDPPAQPNEIEPIGGVFNIPTRQQMAEMARKQRIALGILPAPAQKKAKQAAKRLARMAAEQAPIEEIRQHLVEIPQMWMPAIEPAFMFYLKLERSRLTAQQQIDRIKANEREISAVLAEIERISIIQREEEEAVMLFMQLIAAE